MRTGRMTERIVFTSQTVGEVDLKGDITGTEGDSKPFWAKVTPMRGVRGLQAGQILNGKPYEVTMRYQSDFTPTEDMLILWENKRLTIKSVEDVDNRQTELLITAIDSI
ncbi:phage head closure protein [Rufibacter soli]